MARVETCIAEKDTFSISEAKITKLNTHWRDRCPAVLLEGVDPAHFNPRNTTAITHLDQELGLDDAVLDIQAAMLVSASASDQKEQFLIRDYGFPEHGFYAVRMNK